MPGIIFQMGKYLKNSSFIQRSFLEMVKIHSTSGAVCSSPPGIPTPLVFYVRRGPSCPSVGLYVCRFVHSLICTWNYSISISHVLKVNVMSQKLRIQAKIVFWLHESAWLSITRFIYKSHCGGWWWFVFNMSKWKAHT